MPRRTGLIILISLLLAAVLVWPSGLPCPAEAWAKASRHDFSRQARPDLTVDRVWMGPDCKVRVQIRNKGGGGISPKVSRFDALKVRAGRRVVGRYTFRQVDPGRRLMKPGGRVVYILPIRVTTKARYTAIVDPTHKVAEASESPRSNSASVVLVPCRAAQRQLLMRITKVYVKRGKLHVVLTRAPNFKVDAKSLRAIRLQVRGLGGGGSWILAQIDRSGVLRKRGKIDFNTGLKLKKGSTVRARLSWGKKSKIKVFKVPADTAPVLAAGSARARRPARRSAASPGPVGLVSRIRREQGMRHLRPYDLGVKVLTPRENDVLTMGRSIRVEYRFSTPQEAGRVTFNLVGVGDNGTTAQATALYRPGPVKGQDRTNLIRRLNQVFNWRLPSSVNLEEGREYVVVVMKDSAMGASGSFTFNRLVITDRAVRATQGQDCYGCLFVTAPQAGASWARGASQRIRWKTTPYNREPNGWRVRIHWGHSVRDITPIRVRKDLAAHEYYFDWTVPREFATGQNFRIEVEASNNPWANRPLATYSGVFAIPENSLSFTGGLAQRGRTYYHSNLVPITWRIEGSLNTRVAIDLMQGDQRIMTVVPETTARRGTPAWRVGQGALQPPGDDYYLRARSLDGPAMTGDSARFTIALPNIRVMLPYNGLVYRLGNPLLVRWSAPNLRGEVNILLKKADSNTMRVLGTTLAANGTFTWRVGDQLPGQEAFPLVAGDDYKVVISSEQSGASAQSAGYFGIVIPRPTIHGGR